MRASIPGGRFSVSSEIDRYWKGMDEDLQRTVGGVVAWMRYDPTDTVIDDVYAVASSDGVGRQWLPAIMVPYIVAQVFQGQTLQSDRGFYNTDNLRLTINVADFLHLFPDAVLTADYFLRDRIIFNSKPFRPIRLYLKGRVLDRYAVITLDLVEVATEETINDSQFDTASD